MRGISRVRVGCFVYEVIPMTRDEVDEVGHGVCNYGTCVIKIDETQCYQKQVDTLWHEIKHAIHRVADLTDESKEEDYCTRAAPLELMVLRDNPKLLAIINSLPCCE